MITNVHSYFVSQEQALHDELLTADSDGEELENFPADIEEAEVGTAPYKVAMNPSSPNYHHHPVDHSPDSSLP